MRSPNGSGFARERSARRCTSTRSALLGERAALSGRGRGGQVSCGGATRLIRAADGWVAVSLARPDDVGLIPAWLGVGEVPPEDAWPVVLAAVRERAVGPTVERGVLLGLPVAALPARLGAEPVPCRAEPLGHGPAAGSLEGLVVLELGSLWAAPLCGSLLAGAGARVVKVESTTRPDGARRGEASFFELMNGGKESLALDLGTVSGARTLARAIENADVVIEASRPRALQQLGIDARQVAAFGRPRVWVSITGHGRADGQRVAFGDDAAVAGGLVSWEDDTPCFCADAVADPAGGLEAAAACLDAIASGGRWMLDVSLAGVAASLAGPTLDARGVEALPPCARTPTAPARRLGADTAALLAEWGV